MYLAGETRQTCRNIIFLALYCVVISDFC